MKRRILSLTAVLLFSVSLLLTSCGGKDRSKTLVIYNWGEYMSRESDTYTLYGQDYEITDVIEDFKNAYPEYDVVYSTYDDNEKMYPMIDKESFDIIIPSDYMVVRLIKENKLQKLDMAKLPNVSKYVDPRLSGIQFDPDEAISNQVYSYATPYMYCTVGLIYNRDELGMLTDNAPAQVWQTLFDTKWENRIGMYNSMRESIGAALNYLGYSLNTVAASELEEAKQLLIEQRKTVKPIVGIDDLKDKYVSGELAAGIAWSGDHVVCQQKLEDGGQDPEMLQYILPKGSNMSIDMMCIPSNAQNAEAAHKFINFMYEPDVALKNAVYVGYSSPHIDVIDKLPEEITSNTSYYPDAETVASLELYYSSEEIDSTYDKIWQTILAN